MDTKKKSSGRKSDEYNKELDEFYSAEKEFYEHLVENIDTKLKKNRKVPIPPYVSPADTVSSIVTVLDDYKRYSFMPEINIAEKPIDITDHKRGDSDKGKAYQIVPNKFNYLSDDNEFESRRSSSRSKSPPQASKKLDEPGDRPTYLTSLYFKSNTMPSIGAESLNEPIDIKSSKEIADFKRLADASEAQRIETYSASLTDKEKERDFSRVFDENHPMLKDPFTLFETWFSMAKNSRYVDEPKVAAVATVSAGGVPSNRFMIVKYIPDQGWKFYCHYGSNCSKEISTNKTISVVYYWPPLNRSVRIDGTAIKIPPHESEEYFNRRPRSHQILSLIANTSERVSSRDEIEKLLQQTAKQYRNTKIPMANWGGFFINPVNIEFWKGHKHRLHDRIRFRRGIGIVPDYERIHPAENGWYYERLAP